MNIKVGLIGLGKIGALYDINNQNIMTHIKAILNDKRFELSFAFDPDKERCNLIMKKYGIENIFNNINSIGKNITDIDLLVIASPTFSHFKSIESFLSITDPGIILCEKPLSQDYKNSKKILDLCEKKNIKIISNFMRRSLPAMKSLCKKLKDNSDKKHDLIVKYTGCFKNNGSHFIDLMSFFYGNPTSVIMCSSSIQSNEYKTRAVLEYKNSVCSFIPLFSRQVIDHELQIMTENFKIIITRAGRDMKIYSSLIDKDFKDAREYSNPSDVTTNYHEFQKYVYDDIFDSHRLNTILPNMCSAQQSISNIKLIEELTR